MSYFEDRFQGRGSFSSIDVKTLIMQLRFGLGKTAENLLQRRCNRRSCSGCRHSDFIGHALAKKTLAH